MDISTSMVSINIEPRWNGGQVHGGLRDGDVWNDGFRLRGNDRARMPLHRQMIVHGLDHSRASPDQSGRRAKGQSSGHFRLDSIGAFDVADAPFVVRTISLFAGDH